MVIGGAGRAFVIRLSKGDDLIGETEKLLSDVRVDVALVSGIGSLSHARLGWFDPSKMRYDIEELDGPLEVASLSGNFIRSKDGSTSMHVHSVIGKKEKSWAGHLLEGTVDVNFEVVAIEVSGVTISRVRDEKTGIALISEERQ
ncbi:MAG: PPC domain-containing DNA-binding protein [Thermoprotei archaeon]|jgi:predicted DNA-binding protein with PD1-like motif